ncbi:META domain-containing protein [Stappia sp. 28M-7]|uniref:META domain-containing protein n=1 Tax=Stappia sp. 28M-7 TaxID=2762596 RepID=UPI000FF5EFCF|nr:META domain-containing protein [Stappia sp. 28M-7]MBC2858403.1 META domain-containing protein [Stappia sp. 28M-7]
MPLQTLALLRKIAVLALAAAPLVGLSAHPSSAEAQDLSVTGTWRIEALAAPGGALVDVDQGLSSRTEVTIDRHGMWLASAGCNRLRGTLQQMGHALSVSTRVMATEMACEGPSGDLERRFLHFFPAVTQVDGIPGRVLLRDQSGAAVLLLVNK